MRMCATARIVGRSRSPTGVSSFILSEPGDDARYLQISVPVQPGNSGGALPEIVNYAIKSW
ncbi:MAG: hypothetical protein KIS67_19470 [Verrucomicrobiae bacterium]|nr:hypothetical protein [Verrucomicrobiae bacterium]